ncbi:MAG: 2-amino-4-hydroxy-6-hydroxymethyldihydropteridine diphosphokinase [Leptolyngbya sp. SIO4C1]|nr:2-amino-4-hydroxy-6-hydroxymethyldihydropteridine diphosphokinase [Leptolyngbya sp. SIO4C1]
MARCAIGLGSNLGDSQTVLLSALDRLNAADTRVTARSHLYQTAPIGPAQPDFLNCCACLQTRLPPAQLLQRLLDIEAQFGRIRRERWGPRTLDIDLLLYESQVLETPALTLPHPRLHERAFVLVPLSEIAPNWQHPRLHQSVAALAERCDRSGVRRLPAVSYQLL